MKDLRTSVRLAGLLSVMLWSGGALAELPDSIRSCEGCHGAGGVSKQPTMPSIAGISAPVHAGALRGYRDGAPPCPKSIMCRLSAGLGDEVIDEIAAHYAGLPFVPAEQETDAAKAQRGKELHEAACEECHTGGGSNPADDASILAGQWMPYLRTALADYASGKRLAPELMKSRLDALTEADIEALVHYYGAGR